MNVKARLVRDVVLIPAFLPLMKKIRDGNDGAGSSGNDDNGYRPDAGAPLIWHQNNPISPINLPILYTRLTTAVSVKCHGNEVSIIHHERHAKPQSRKIGRGLRQAQPARRASASSANDEGFDRLSQRRGQVVTKLMDFSPLLFGDVSDIVSDVWFATRRCDALTMLPEA